MEAVRDQQARKRINILSCYSHRWGNLNEGVFPMNATAKPVVILMVDDDIEDIYSTKRAFSEGKIVNDFHHVTGGEELFEYLENKGSYNGDIENPRPHIILLDINMPKQSGLEILEKLRKMPKFRAIPVVMLTTSDQENDILDSYERGANSFVTKPVNIEGMLKVAQDFENYWFQLVAIPDPQSAAEI